MTSSWDLLRDLAELARDDVGAAWDACRARPALGREAGLAALTIGAASAAAHEYESRMRTEEGRVLDPDYQRRLGVALGRIETAECILEESAEDDAGLRTVAREAFMLAYAALHDLVGHAAGSGARSERALHAVLATAGDSMRSEESDARQLALERLARSG